MSTATSGLRENTVERVVHTSDCIVSELPQRLWPRRLRLGDSVLEAVAQALVHERRQRRPRRRDLGHARNGAPAHLSKHHPYACAVDSAAAEGGGGSAAPSPVLRLRLLRLLRQPQPVIL